MNKNTNAFPATRAAVEAGKIYYHTNLLGSKTYTTHADNTVASWQEYDVWGVPQAAGNRSQDLGDRGTNGDLNLTAVAVRAQYTNHDYDAVLGEAIFVVFHLKNSG